MRLLDPEKGWNSTTLRDKGRVGMRKGNNKKKNAKYNKEHVKRFTIFPRSRS